MAVLSSANLDTRLPFQLFVAYVQYRTSYAIEKKLGGLGTRLCMLGERQGNTMMSL